MKIFCQSTALAATLGLALGAATAGAASVSYYSLANAPARCQPFTPGSTTLRNRVTGIENTGTALAVSCAFENVSSPAGTNNERVALYLVNNTGASVAVNCSELSGWYGLVLGSLINKTATLNPLAADTLIFTAADTPSTTDTDLGSFLSGVNCTLPTGVVLARTQVDWHDENGL